MILADKIIEERKRLGWSQEELAAQLDVSRQSVSKWESAQSIPDINRILQMAQLFGVSTDYLLKDDAVREGAPAAEAVSESVRSVRPVGMEEASSYLALRAKQAPVIAFGVALCVASAAPLMFLTALTVDFGGSLPAGAAEVAGVAVLLLLVAVAVFFFIRCGGEAERYEYLEKVEIETAYGVDGLVKEKRAAFADTRTKATAVGVVLCILSAVPLILVSAVTENGAAATAMVGVLLLMVAAAVYLFVRTGVVSGSHDALLQEGDYTVNKKKNAPVLHRVSVIYWLAATALYLAVSLPRGSWDTSWVVWPVAGVLFFVVIVVTKMVIRAED